MNRKLLALSIAFTVALTAPLNAQRTTVLRAARMIDGTGGATVRNAVIVVTGAESDIGRNDESRQRWTK